MCGDLSLFEPKKKVARVVSLVCAQRRNTNIMLLSHAIQHALDCAQWVTRLNELFNIYGIPKTAVIFGSSAHARTFAEPESEVFDSIENSDEREPPPYGGVLQQPARPTRASQVVLR